MTPQQEPKPEKAALWDAINDYTRACKGDTSNKTASLARMNAVVQIERLWNTRANDGDSVLVPKDTLAKVAKLISEKIEYGDRKTLSPALAMLAQFLPDAALEPAATQKEAGGATAEQRDIPVQILELEEDILRARHENAATGAVEDTPDIESMVEHRNWLMSGLPNASPAPHAEAPQGAASDPSDDAEECELCKQYAAELAATQRDRDALRAEWEETRRQLGDIANRISHDLSSDEVTGNIRVEFEELHELVTAILTQPETKP